MSGLKPVAGDRGASAADYGRLWQTLITEMVSDLQVVIIAEQDQNGFDLIAVEAVSPSLHQIDGVDLVNVWARKEFRNQLHLISVGQLFDLLITAYRVIDRFFDEGEAAAPPRRKR